MAWFFRSKLKHPDEQVRLRALQKLSDPNKIVQVACQDVSPTVRLEAVRKLTDPNHLAEVVKNGEGLEARVQAVGRIQDQKLLAQILLERKNNDIMQAAFENLTDPEVLKVIAEDGRYNIATRRIAIDNFADQSFLEDVAKNVTTPGVKEAALKRLSEEGAAAPAATTPEDTRRGSPGSRAHHEDPGPIRYRANRRGHRQVPGQRKSDSIPWAHCRQGDRRKRTGRPFPGEGPGTLESAHTRVCPGRDGRRTHERQARTDPGECLERP